MPRPAALPLALLLSALPAAADTLDTRAASQRACLAEAERAGLRVIHIARPVPIPGRLFEIWGETVRMQTSGHVWLRCIYEIAEMRAELRH